MMKPILFSLFDHPVLTHDDYEIGDFTLHQFPDDETYIKVNTVVKDRKVVLITSLDHPNTKLLPLLLVCETLRDLGAEEVGLVVPYLAYMRQDKRFNVGEGITAKYFASLLSQYFDWLITVDPHLHRIKNLGEIYTIPTTVLHATDAISRWIKKEIENPLIIGPDGESEQWIASIAKDVGAPYVISEKIRRGDRDVESTTPDLEKYPENTPVLVDDIISTAKTMLQTIQHLKTMQMKPAVCIGIHAIFSGDAYAELLHSGVDRVITCNTIHHPSNAIDLGAMLMDALNNLAAND